MRCGTVARKVNIGRVSTSQQGGVLFDMYQFHHRICASLYPFFTPAGVEQHPSNYQARSEADPWSIRYLVLVRISMYSTVDSTRILHDVARDCLYRMRKGTRRLLE